MQLHAFIVVSWAASPAQSCITNAEHTIMVTESDVSNDTLAGTQGRLIATGSTEGVLQGRILDLIQSGRLDGKHTAIVAGTAPADVAFDQTATTLLHENKIPVVPAAQADAFLVPGIDPLALPLLSQTTAATHHKTPVEVYGFSDVTDQSLDQLRQSGGVAAAQSVAQLGVFGYLPIQDEAARLGQSAGPFAAMCSREYVASHGKGVTTTTTTLPPASPPTVSSDPYTQVARICLAMRIVARGLYNAGIDVTQASAIKAFHKLAYIENELADGSKKPRPNQVINEPVARVEQVVVLSQAEYPCKHPSLPQNPADYRMCWVPVSGWDSGGRVVNAPLLGSTSPTAHVPPVSTTPTRRP